MIKVQVSPRKAVYVKAEKDTKGVFCTFYGDNTEDFPIGDKFVQLPKDCSANTINLAMVRAAKDYFGK